MKTARILTFITGTLLFAMVSCKPQEDDPVSNFTDGIVVTTNTPSNIAGTTAICGSEVKANDMGLMIELGVCWSKNEQPTVDNHVEKTYKCSQPFNCILTNLDPNTQYHVRGYAKYGTEYCYGDEISFTTLNDSTSIWSTALTTIPAYEIYTNGFMSGGTLTLPNDIDFNLNLQLVGICISESPNPTIENGKYFFNNYYGNPFLIQLYDLEPNTQYYYRAFLAFGNGLYGDYYYTLNQFDIIYGDILTVTTLDIPFTLNVYTNYPEYDWWSNSISMYGYMNTNKLNVIDEVGFCYSHTNEYPQFESDLVVSVGTPLSNDYTFYSQITDLSANTKYYIRAYARYMTDSIKYGLVETFYTNKSPND